MKLFKKLNKIDFYAKAITRECVHLVTRGYYRSHHSIGRIQKPLLYANFMALALWFTEPELLPIEVLHSGNRDFRPFLLLWPWPWSDDLHIQTVFPRDIPDVRKWTFYVKTCESVTERQTDTTDCYIPRRFVGDQWQTARPRRQAGADSTDQ